MVQGLGCGVQGLGFGVQDLRRDWLIYLSLRIFSGGELSDGYRCTSLIWEDLKVCEL